MAERETRRLVTQIFGPRYCFTEEGTLLEAARSMLVPGCDTIKFDCNPHGYPEGKSFLGRPAETLALPHHREVLNLPFRNYILWVNPNYFADGPNWREHVCEEIHTVSAPLLREYAGTGRRPTAPEFGQPAYLLRFFQRQIAQKRLHDVFERHVEVRK